MKLVKNMGTIDRVIRLVLALVFLLLYFGGLVSGVLGTILLILAVVFILTSAVSFCPLYTLFKLSTRK
ncbi:MAG: DUF2892 domain-containing protein [Anaerolineales bacterium]|nr:DUF2892 domain-containing protein [Anaerolineales bacterium]MCX7609017.1 DUF2892 domain-containing protein [Anaerolineales bacterium]MDW8227287.1 DUF2892 domain-containing protein [Anaerolineales bacterium]